MTLVKTIYYHGVEDFVNHERNILSVTLQIAFFIAYSFKVYAWIQEFVWKKHCKTTSPLHLNIFRCNQLPVMYYFREYLVTLANSDPIVTLDRVRSVTRYPLYSLAYT